MNLSKQAKFSLFFFPLWIFVSYAFFYEGLYPNYEYGLAREFHLVITCAFSGILLLASGIPSFLLLRKNEIGTKAKILMLITVVAIACFLIPRTYASYPNKMRVQEYINDLERKGFSVEYSDSFAYEHFTPIWIYSYSNFTSTLQKYNATSVIVSAGVPYCFLFSFPREIEIRCGITGVGYYIMRVDWSTL